MSGQPRTPGRLPEHLRHRLSVQLSVVAVLGLVTGAGLLGIVVAPILDRILLTGLAAGLMWLLIVAAVGFFRGD